MNLFGGYISVTGVSFLMFSVMAIAALGYVVGRITFRGISLGTAGVFLIAIIYGCLFYDDLAAATEGYTKNALKIIENMGLILFVTSVGFIAGPNFFANLKKNFKSYVLMGLVIIISGGIAAVACIYIGRATGETDYSRLTAMVVGLFSGAMTSTPAFSASKASVAPELEDIVSVGYGIAYIFGVIGVVLFVQLMPKLTKANIPEEIAKISQDKGDIKRKAYTGTLLEMDDFGIMPFALAAVIGVFVGSIKIPMTGSGLSGTTFSLTTTGGCLLIALMFGHFGRIGRVSIMPLEITLKEFRELGLMLFLIGAGVSAGESFIQSFQLIYFFYGVLMTSVPMIIGYLFGRHVLKLALFNSLGSITGGMTSTPALGTLIHVAGSEDVAASYASTYPVALIIVVLVSQMIALLF